MFVEFVKAETLRNWYDVYLDGRKVGYLCRTSSATGWDARVAKSRDNRVLYETYRYRADARAAIIAACEGMEADR